FFGPVLLTFSYSLQSYTQIEQLPPALWPSPFAWSNFTGAIASFPFWHYLYNTVVNYGLVSFIGTLLTAPLSAFALSRLRSRFRTPVFLLLLASLLLPQQATILPLYIAFSHLHLIGTYVPLVIANYLGGAAFNIFLLRQFMLTIPRELDEAGRIDGCSSWQLFFRIILPLTKPALAVVALLHFFYVFNDFFAPLIYLSDPNQFTLAVGLAQLNTFYASQYNYLMAAAVMVMLPLILVFVLTQRFLTEGIAMSGIKA
ncbi:MAG TPA: carbohydrate ABC transporter permease, partial [Chloroflexota bacterium]|nr:carbohydrate ABC transporter permease [Chloroflexota bacterium]